MNRRVPVTAALAAVLASGCATTLTGHEPPALPVVTASGSPAPVQHLHVGQRLVVSSHNRLAISSSTRSVLARDDPTSFHAVAPGRATVSGADHADPPPPCARRGCAYAVPGPRIQVTVVR